MEAFSIRLLQDLVMCVLAATAAGSFFVGLSGLRRQQVNPTAKKALEQKKGIFERLGRPLVDTNPHEDVIARDVINPDHIDVKFDSIGGLDATKQDLIELSILPIQRPELFSRRRFLGPQKGLLLYGPPGTGKTMLAKAIAKESGAVFINVKMSKLIDSWFGEPQKFVSAVFSLAHKLQPAIIFIDEVDIYVRC